MPVSRVCKSASSGRKGNYMYINAIEAKRMVTEDKELNAKFRELIRGIAQLYAFQARTSEYSMSPERIVIRRETEVQVLTRLIGQVVRLNRESGCSFLPALSETSIKPRQNGI